MSRWIGPVRAGLLVTALCVALFEGVPRLFPQAPGLLSQLERQSLDTRFRIRGAQPITEKVAVVALDDKSLQKYGERLGKRAGFADLVAKIRASGAKVIGIDAFFADEERVLPPALVRDIEAFLASRDQVDPAARGLFDRVLAEEEGDERLAKVFGASEDVVIALHSGEHMGFEELRSDVTKATYGQQVAGAEMPFAARRIIASLPRFHEAAARIGIATIIVGVDDQTAREVHVGRTFQRRILVPFSVQLTAAALDVPRSRLAYSASSRALSIGDRAYLASDGHTLLVNHRGGPETFAIYSASDVLDDVVKDELEDAVVIVGFTELGQDAVRTPYSAHLPGAALHANVVSNLLRGDLLVPAPGWLEVLLVALAGLFGALLYSARLRFGALARVMLTLGFAALWLVAAHTSFTEARLVLPIVGPIITLLLASFAGLAVAYGAEGVMRAKLRRTFAHYLSDDVISELLSNPDSLALGGARRELTVMFSDIRKFTTLSEGLEPLDLVRFLNAYLTPMTRAVLDHRGLLDKYIGDAVMAVFGAPVLRAQHADDGLSCALEMHAKLEELRGELGDIGEKLEIGVGLNSGEMVVGNMGSRERFDYTVVGDAVNLASRVEGLTKNYGVFCLVGQETRKRASERFRFREIDLVTVKGKKQPVAIFELLGDESRTIASYEAMKDWYEGLEAYRAGKFNLARTSLDRFLEANPGDVSAALLTERMASMGTPPEGWTGVFEHTTK
jgi:adenylate cyclase